jgi:3-isopropylmalate/(R)-2-methylmalate dehydratase small subunit
MTQQFRQVTAVAVPYDAINVDTDQIIPARFLKYERRPDGYGKFLFHDERLNEDGTEKPGFILNQPVYRGAQILVGNENFGCGSSREGAVYAFDDAGFRAVIAPSFGDIFFNNCLKNGVVPARLPAPVCDALRAQLHAKPGATITVDLERQVVVGPDGAEHAFTIDGFFREMMLKGVDEIGLTLSMLPEIEAFERAYGASAPWVVR